MSAIFTILFFALLIFVIVFIVRKSNQRRKLNIPEMYSSVILNKGEEITEHFQGTYLSGDNHRGIVVFTNKRFLFLKRASGWGSKGYNVIMFCSWGDVVSVSTSGSNYAGKLNLNVNNQGMSVFRCMNVQDVAKKIIENKNNFAEKVVIEAKTIIIEEANKDKAMEILQKRLARGEISIEEFHKLVQRT